jgi:3-isopropylmalate/(R)-2-methylmalate dehydratase large subunit
MEEACKINLLQKGEMMGFTIAEKILGSHAGSAPAKAGDVVVASVDFAMLHDARASNALKRISEFGTGKLPFAARTAFVLDH